MHLKINTARNLLTTSARRKSHTLYFLSRDHRAHVCKLKPRGNCILVDFLIGKENNVCIQASILTNKIFGAENCQTLQRSLYYSLQQQKYHDTLGFGHSIRLESGVSFVAACY